MARSGRPWCQGDWTPVAELCKDYAWLLLSPSPVLLAFQEGREGGTSVLGQEAEGLQARGLRQRGSRRKAVGGALSGCTDFLGTGYTAFLERGVAYNLKVAQNLLVRADKPNCHIRVAQGSVSSEAQATFWGQASPLGL